MLRSSSPASTRSSLTDRSTPARPAARSAGVSVCAAATPRLAAPTASSAAWITSAAAPSREPRPAGVPASPSPAVDGGPLLGGLAFLTCPSLAVRAGGAGLDLPLREAALSGLRAARGGGLPFAGDAAGFLELGLVASAVTLMGGGARGDRAGVGALVLAGSGCGVLAGSGARWACCRSARAWMLADWGAAGTSSSTAASITTASPPGLPVSSHASTGAASLLRRASISASVCWWRTSSACCSRAAARSSSPSSSSPATDPARDPANEVRPEWMGRSNSEPVSSHHWLPSLAIGACALSVACRRGCKCSRSSSRPTRSPTAEAARETATEGG
mmetsp:Transcript_10378/g.26432  ORF Transcript_10378/g.26432 Transcript_10378/m.26432 type:complete len:332 (-) Transcript_10378:549-1544(-)